MSDGMTTGLDLDARQRAMLDEMGVRVWWPAVAPAPASLAEAMAPAVAPVAPPRPIRAPVPVAPPKTVAPPAAAPSAPRAAASGVAVRVEAPRRLYGEGSVDGRHLASSTGGWLVVADMPPDADGRYGEPFAGDAGRLLDNMLRALQLHGGAVPVHLMRTHREAGPGRTDREHEPQSFGEGFLPLAGALAPRVILAMGPLAAQSLLQSADPLGRLRGRAVPLAALGGAPVVATYHPAYLLRNMADKARAWADLCLAAASSLQR